MGLRRILDKVADALVPKEIAPFLGPAAMAFAGPLSMPIALGIGQLGAAKMMSGKLDPYTALGTVLSAQGFKARNPERYGSIARGLRSGLGTFMPGGATPMDFGSEFMRGFQTNVVPVDLTGAGGTTPFTKTRMTPTTIDNPLVGSGEGQITPTMADAAGIDQKIAGAPTMTSETFAGGTPDAPGPNLFDRITGSVGEAIFPGFTDDAGEFSFGKALRTVGAATTISALTPMAEELKRQRALDKAEEGKIFTEWFNSYKRISGRDYADSPFPDPVLMEKYREFMMAQGGRVGYNMGGGIMDAAPGVPPGMELDYRESGGFIPMGSQEKKDDVPAVLAKNEFVLTSDAMTGLDKMMGGSGDPRAAAKYMYQMMDQLEAMA